MRRKIGRRRNMQAVEALELSVRSFSHCFAAVFSRGRGSVILTEASEQIFDFLIAHNIHESEPQY